MSVSSMSKRAICEALPSGMVAILISATWPASASAQAASPKTPVPAVVSTTISGIFSFQPKSYRFRPPYLDYSLGGTVPGISVAIQRSATRWPSVAIELSSTAKFEAVQSGRLVAGEYLPVLSKHRDTLFSILLGKRFANGAFEPKAGLSFVFSELRQGDVERKDMNHVAYTAGFDGVARLGRRLDLVPSIRYSLVPRSPAGQYAGLGNDVIRAGVGVRIRFRPKAAQGAGRTSR